MTNCEIGFVTFVGLGFALVLIGFAIQLVVAFNSRLEYRDGWYIAMGDRERQRVRWMARFMFSGVALMAVGDMLGFMCGVIGL